MDGEIQVEESPLTGIKLHEFFRHIVDVNDLNPAEERQEAWEARIDGDRTGMAVVDTFPRGYGFVSRVAVKKKYRRRGVATALLDRIHKEHDELVCRVHEDNDSSLALVEEYGFTATGQCFHTLVRYETDPDE